MHFYGKWNLMGNEIKWAEQSSGNARRWKCPRLYSNSRLIDLQPKVTANEMLSQFNEPVSTRNVQDLCPNFWRPWSVWKIPVKEKLGDLITSVQILY